MKKILVPNNKGEGLKEAYEFEDIAFVNTNLFNETARYFMKNGVYTKAAKNSLEYKHFWDIEEERLTYGMKAPGKLYRDEFGNQKIQEVWITPEHYSYLNYGRIKRTKDLQAQLAAENILKDTRISGTKTVSFPDFWDTDYHYYWTVNEARKRGLNIIVLKARRKGFSYKNSGLAAHTAQFIPFSTTILGAYDMKYLTQGDAISVMTRNQLDWYEQETDFNRGFLKEDLLNLELGYMEEKTTIKKGYRSKVLSVTFKDNPNAVIGKDANLIILEEAGNFPNLRETLKVTMSTMESGEVITGTMILFGTGGTKEANWAEFEELYNNPETHRFLPFNNVWDEGKAGTTCGFFHGHLNNLEPHMDEWGNTLLEKATASDDAIREKQKDVAKNAKDYLDFIGQRCRVPSEAFNSGGVSIYDSAELRTHYEEVKHNPKIKYLHREGIVQEFAEGIKLITNDLLTPSERKSPLNSYNLSLADSLDGCFVEWYPPYRIGGKVPTDLYRGWHDPYAFEKDKQDIRISDSLGATYIYERANNYTETRGDILVGAYIGRPSDPDTYNAHLLNIIRYYNAKLQFESDRGDVKGFFKRAGYYHYLADEPDFAWKKEFQGNKTVAGKGIMMAEGSNRKGDAAILLKQWLYQKRGFRPNGEIMYNFHTIFDLGLLDELIKWNFKGNFDRVSALLVGILDMNEIRDKVLTAASNEAKNSIFDREWF